MAASSDDVKEVIGGVPGFVSYYSTRDVQLVRDAGFKAALTCEFGTNPTPFAEPFELRRTIVEASDPLWVFSGRLDGATDRAPLGRRSRRVEATL